MIKLGPRHFYASVFVAMTVPTFAYFYLQYDREQALANAKYKVDTTKTSREAFDQIAAKAKADIEAQKLAAAGTPAAPPTEPTSPDKSAASAPPPPLSPDTKGAIVAPQAASSLSESTTASVSTPASDLASTFIYVRTDKALLRFQMLKNWSAAAEQWNERISHHDLTVLAQNPSVVCGTEGSDKICRSIAETANAQLETASPQQALYLVGQPTDGVCEAHSLKQIFLSNEAPNIEGCRIAELTTIAPYKKGSLKNKKFATRPAVYITSSDTHSPND